jgi:hypothetical protein
VDQIERAAGSTFAGLAGFERELQRQGGVRACQRLAQVIQQSLAEIVGLADEDRRDRAQDLYAGGARRVRRHRARVVRPPLLIGSESDAIRIQQLELIAVPADQDAIVARAVVLRHRSCKHS